MAKVEHAIVLLGGGEPPDDLPLFEPGARVIAADSGLALAVPLGLRAHIVVGDLDSVDPELLGRAAGEGTEIEMHPTDKDATDLELALRHAVDVGARTITIVGGAGGRADHHLANVAALAAPYLAGVEVVAQLGAARCTVVRREAQVLGVPGSLVSLLPIGATATGVTTHGMRWELIDADLEPHSTRGISNELIGRLATVRLTAGVLLAVQPHSGAHGEPDLTPTEG